MNETSERSAIVTGATAGLGLACAELLAARGWHVVLACRDAGRGEAARARIGPRAEVRELDVADLGSVRRFAAELEATKRPPLAALVCNAGVQAVTGDVQLTADGLERTFATNHLGHYALARLLLPDMAPGAQIIFVASGTHDPKRFTGMPAPRLDARSDLLAVARGAGCEGDASATAARRRYTTSKLCNVLCAYELQRRLAAAAAPGAPAVRVNAFDPGLMPGTGLARDYGPIARFAWNHVLPALAVAVPNVNRVSTSAERLVALVEDPAAAGTYVSCGRPTRSSEASYDEVLAANLWRASAELAALPAALTRAEALR